MESGESDVCYLKVNAVFSGQPMGMLQKYIRNGLKVTKRARGFCVFCSLKMFFLV